MDKKVGFHDILSESFCLTVPKYFLGEPFLVSENFWYRKILRIRREGITIFPPINKVQNVGKGWD